MTLYKREKMSARVACVEAIDNWPDRAHAALTDCGDVDNTMASWQKGIEKEVAIDDRERKRPMALNRRPFHKSYRDKFNQLINLALIFVKLNFSSHSGWNRNRSWTGIPAI
jgi:hypothetical protein